MRAYNNLIQSEITKAKKRITFYKTKITKYETTELNEISNWREEAIKNQGFENYDYQLFWDLYAELGKKIKTAKKEVNYWETKLKMALENAKEEAIEISDSEPIIIRSTPLENQPIFLRSVNYEEPIINEEFFH